MLLIFLKNFYCKCGGRAFLFPATCKVALKTHKKAQSNLGRKLTQKAIYLVQTPAQRKPICIRYFVQTSLGISKDRGSTISLGNLFQCLTSFTVNVCFLVSHCNFPCCNLCLLPMCCLCALLRSVLQAVRGWPPLLCSADSSSAVCALVSSRKICDEFPHLGKEGNMFISLLLFLTFIVHYQKRLMQRKHSYSQNPYIFLYSCHRTYSKSVVWILHH